MWSSKDRLETIRFLGQYARNLNVYLYCPKDDPYVVKKWNQLYPTIKLNELRQTIELCRSLNIEFVFGLNPTLNKSRSVDDIIKKLIQLKNIGCKNFCLLFDDIPYAYELIDNPKSVEGKSVGNEIVNLTNFIYNKIGKPKQFWLCTPDYCFKKRSPFTEALSTLNPNISLMWTGNNIFAKTISAGDIKRVKRITKCQKLIWWSNYPVNDCEQNIGIYNLNGFVKLKPKILSQLEGVLVNPMREPYATLLLFITFSDYLKDPQDYFRKDSLRNSINKLERNKTYNHLYLGAIEPAIKYKNYIKNLSFLIRNRNQIEINFINTSDIFPTNPNIDRYFPEIFKIVRCRLGLIRKFQFCDIPKNIVDFENYFSQVYTGRKKLCISKVDSKQSLDYSKELIKLDQKYLVDFLNRNDVTIKSKLRIFAQRERLNRFTCEMIK